VQGALDAAALGIGGDGEPLTRCTQLRDLEAQRIELSKHVVLPILQGGRPPANSDYRK